MTIICIVVMINIKSWPDNQLDTGESSLEQLHGLLMRFSLNAHLCFIFVIIVIIIITWPTNKDRWVVDLMIIPLLTPLTERSWSPLFKPPCRSATPPEHFHCHRCRRCHRCHHQNQHHGQEAATFVQKFQKIWISWLLNTDPRVYVRLIIHSLTHLHNITNNITNANTTNNIINANTTNNINANANTPFCNPPPECVSRKWKLESQSPSA